MLPVGFHNGSSSFNASFNLTNHRLVMDAGVRCLLWTLSFPRLWLVRKNVWATMRDSPRSSRSGVWIFALYLVLPRFSTLRCNADVRPMLKTWPKSGHDNFGQPGPNRIQSDLATISPNRIASERPPWLFLSQRIINLMFRTNPDSFWYLFN